MSKLFCFDLDGTLLCDDKSITSENKNALKEAQKTGHSIAIVTGRSMRGSRMIVEELNMKAPNCYLISFQGNVVYDLYNENIIYDAGVSAANIISLLKDLNKEGIYAQTFDYGHIITTAQTFELERYNKIAKEDITFISSWDDLTNQTYPKVIAIEYKDTNKLYKFQKDFFSSSRKEEFDCFFSSPYFLEFCKKDSNKGYGVKALAEYLQISKEDVIAVGDERNDVSMIQYAGIGCAMANAHKEAKAVADYITSNNNNYSGVAEIIQKYLF